MYCGPDEAAQAPKSISSESSLREGCTVLAACSRPGPSVSELLAVSAASWPGSKAAGWKLSEKQVPRRCSCLAPASCNHVSSMCQGCVKVVWPTCQQCVRNADRSSRTVQPVQPLHLGWPTARKPQAIPDESSPGSPLLGLQTKVAWRRE